MSSLGSDLAESLDASNEPPDDESIPSLPRYSLIRKLAVGGMARVFIAQKEGASDLCVIKQLHSHLAAESVIASRFIREAQVSFHLNHPKIARILDSKREGGLLYIAMEYIPGQDVESMMFKLMEQRKMLPPELSLTVTLDVFEALAYAHDCRGPDGSPLEIVHRDLSPRNVMVSYDGAVKVIDFGLARATLGDFRTAPGMVLGTLRYMSPEQAVAESVDRRSDIYSWSVVLYEMLSGRPLVMGANPQEILKAVMSEVPPPLSTWNPMLPKALDAVLAKGLAKDRRDRFATAGEMREALLACAGPLASITEERHQLIGRFVRDLFPEAAQESNALVLGATAQEGRYEPTIVGPPPRQVTQSTYLARLREAASAMNDAPPKVMELTQIVPGRRSIATSASRMEGSGRKRLSVWTMLSVVSAALFVTAVTLFVQTQQKARQVTMPVTEPLVVQRLAPTATRVTNSSAESPHKSMPGVKQDKAQVAAPVRSSNTNTRQPAPPSTGSSKSEAQIDRYEGIERALKRSREEFKQSGEKFEPKALTESIARMRQATKEIPDSRQEVMNTCLDRLDNAASIEGRITQAEKCLGRLREVSP